MDLIWYTEQRKVNDLVPYEHNPRKLSEDKKNQLIKSIERFNLAEIPAINLDNKVIAGHQRLKVLQSIGRGEEIIDVRVPNRMLTEEEFKEYNITSNVQVGIWDVDILKEVFSDIDLDNLGLDINEIQNSIPDTTICEDEKEEEFVAAPPVVPLTVLGDVYEMISLRKNITHRLHCADSKDSDAVAKLMNDKKASMVFTDPPYNVKIDSIVNLGKTHHEEFAEASGEMTEDEFIQFLTDIFNNNVLFSINGSIHYICMDWKHIYEIISAGKASYSEFKQLCVWNKDNGGMGTFYRSKHELIFVFKNGDAKHINNFELGQYGRYRTNVWDYAGANSFSSNATRADDHPTPKSVAMVVDAMLDCSNKNDIILDLFVGSGTSIVAAEQTRRICYGQEFSESYCDVDVRRWIKYMRDNSLPYELKRNGVLLTENEIEEYFK